MSLELDAKTTALVLIDLEHGIVAMKPEPHSADEVVERSAKLAESFRKAGGTVVYVHVLLHDIVRMPADQMMPVPSTPPPPELSDLVPEAGFQPGKDVLVAKRGWDAFYGTDLELQLFRRGIKTIVLGGIATNMGVESTARSAQARNYAVVFAEDAMSSRKTELHAFAVEKIFPVIGKVRSAKEIAKGLR